MGIHVQKGDKCDVIAWHAWDLGRRVSRRSAVLALRTEGFETGTYASCLGDQAGRHE